MHKWWRIGAALLLVVALVSVAAVAAFAQGGAADGGVKQVSVTLDKDETEIGGNVTITVNVLTGGSSDDDWWGGGASQIQVFLGTGGASQGTKAIGNTTGSSSVVEFVSPAFSGWAGAGTTNTVETYGIVVTLVSPAGTVVYGSQLLPLATFDVVDYIVSASPFTINAGDTTTITIVTGWTTDWEGNITVTDPDAVVSWLGTAVDPGDTSAVYPDDFIGGVASTALASDYGISVEITSLGTDPTGTFTGSFDVPSIPHKGTFSTTDDACAACHRVHTAQGPKLLRETNQYNLCTSCHNGTGANNNVVDGVYEGSTQGTNGAGLRGGGFTNAIMDTDVSGGPSTGPTTSKHSVSTGDLIVWGSGGLGSNDAGNTGVTLECGSCHNPHGNSNYRILRGTPDPVGFDDEADDPVLVPAGESQKRYTVDYKATNYRDLGKYPASVLANMSNWCGQCHTRYNAGVDSGNTPSGDSVFAYRHMTDGLGGECMKCHVAHGTSATMSGNAGASGPIVYPDATSAPWQGIAGESEHSRLLQINNRGVCIQCHNDAELTQGE